MDNRTILPGASDLVTGDVLADGSFAQGVKILDGTNDSLNVLVVNAAGQITVINLGDVLSGAADGGSAPVKVGGRSNATPPTLADGQRGDMQLDTRGNIKVALAVPNGSGFATAAGDALTASSILPGGEYVYNGTTWDRVRGPNKIFTVAAVAITAGTGATIWTPTAGKKFRLMGWSLSASVAASLIFGDNLVATVIQRSELLAAAGISQTPPGYGNGFLSAAANNVLKLDVTATATVSGFVFGTEE